MRRADRLFRIVQLLQGRRRAVTAQVLAGRLEISERTLYRDIRDLVGSGVPIHGEAGVGYVLDRSFELPPVMFDREEVSALALGISIVKGWGDESLARAATRALEKLRTVAPPELAATFADLRVSAVNFNGSAPLRRVLLELRQAVLDRRELRLHYQRKDGLESHRVVRPLAITFTAPHWLLVTWCTLRVEFRVFRVDRILALDAMDTHFEDEPGRNFEAFLQQMGGGTEEQL